MPDIKAEKIEKYLETVFKEGKAPLHAGAWQRA